MMPPMAAPEFVILMSDFLQRVLINRRRIVIFSSQHKDIPATSRHGILETGGFSKGLDIGSECRDIVPTEGRPMVGRFAGISVVA